MSTLYTGKVQVRGGRDGSVRSDDGQLEARLAFPKSMGGDGKGANPEQLFGAGYAACFASTVAAIGRAEGTPVANVTVDAEVDVVKEGDTFDLRARLTVRAEGTEHQRLTALVEKAKLACPYSRATRSTIATTVTVVP